MGAHTLRGRVDRVDRLPGGEYELIDYKTGRPKTAAQLREDVQLALYAVGASEAWELDASRQAYLYVLDDAKVPLPTDEVDRDWISETVFEVADGILGPGLRADAVLRRVLDVRLPHRVPGGGALSIGAARRRPLERDPQVLDEVLRRLDAARQPHEVGRNRRVGVLDGLVRHRGRHLDERLHAAERLGQREDLGALRDRDRRRGGGSSPCR